MSKTLYGFEGGRGITVDPAKNILYISNGSSSIQRMDASTFEPIDKFDVKHSETSLQKGITELEFVDGYIWASVKFYMGMIQIDPDTGMITKKISFHPLH